MAEGPEFSKPMIGLSVPLVGIIGFLDFYTAITLFVRKDRSFKIRQVKFNRSLHKN